MKKLTLSLLSLLLLFTLSSCVTPESQVVYRDVPLDSIVLKRETLRKLLDESILQKSLLIECLERERECKQGR